MDTRLGAERQYDVLVIGAGLAGMSVALSLPAGLRVAVLAKSALDACASDQAQGGIAAAVGPGDSVDAHAADTHVAGAGLCDRDAVQATVTDAPEVVQWLRAHGVAFTTSEPDSSTLHLTREGGHGERRIVHAADATGHAICEVLFAKLAARPGVDVYTHCAAVDLLTGTDARGARRCGGALVWDLTASQARALRATHTVLATGGLGQLFRQTTNPATATGDGIALAWRAGCRVANLEFVQFHPTGLRVPGAAGFLISEAVRGEGGLLRLPDGTRFMPSHDARAELAPRDIVARAIAHEMQVHGLDSVGLDISHQSPAFLAEHFPNILARCRELGIDMCSMPIPVAPSAHYSCGGVLTDVSGRCDLPGLYAVGEVACTGLHGANRLASNSLLECAVMGRAAAAVIAQAHADGLTPIDAPVSSATLDALACTPLVQTHWDALRSLMWTHVGLLRDGQGLETALVQLSHWRGGAQNVADAATARALDAAMGSATHAAPTQEVSAMPACLAWRQALDTAFLLTRSALGRQESRGVHTRRDWPDSLDALARPTVLAGFDGVAR